MLRQSLIYLILSILIVLFSKYVHFLVIYIDLLFTYVNVLLTPIFSQTGWGLMTRKILVLTFLPLIIMAVPALLYRAIKGVTMPHYIALTWIFWIVIVLSDILVR